jgi:hypothetical protein
MGVAASGATLEIQLVADVARLQRDMKDMQTIVKGATSSASRSFDDLAKGSVAAATAHAAAAQTIARSAVTGAAGVRSLGMAASNSNIANAGNGAHHQECGRAASRRRQPSSRLFDGDRAHQHRGAI